MRQTIRPDNKGIFPRVKQGVVHNVCLGNMTMFGVVVIRDDGFGNTFVALEGQGSYAFGGPPDTGYTKEKLKLKYDSDAANMSDFISDQMTEKPGQNERQGEYQETLCKTK